MHPGGSFRDKIEVLPEILTLCEEHLDKSDSADVPTAANASIELEGVSDLRSDALFNMSWVYGASGMKQSEVLLARENCSSFIGNGFVCYLEAPEHTLTRKWIPADAIVMEFGSRFGTTTCEIAKKLQNSGRLVTVEPDPVVLGSGYGGRSAVGDNAPGVDVPTFSFDAVQKA